jgi:lysophospholipase L1-like esterase
MLALSAAIGARNAVADAVAPAAQDGKVLFKFAFGPGKAPPGYIQVAPTTAYDEQRGYGFEPGAKVTTVDRGGDSFASGFSTSERFFFFSVAVPEGNYRVTVTLGDRTGPSKTTVKAELRRLMLEGVRTGPGQLATRTFTVNVRTPQIASGGQVRLKSRETTAESRNWDNKLTLEFSDSRPCLAALEIAKADNAVTIYLLGDSTVCDQPSAPWSSWGQMLPRFFKPEVAVANHAESGESLRSSLAARRLDKVLSKMKAGDYLFIQYGHNDMKERGEGFGAFTTYRADLKRVIAGARNRGGIPVLVTSMHRKKLDASGKVINTLGDYPEAVRRTAKEENVPLIDLNAMSKRLYEALGPQNIAKAFQDDTHHNNYGSYELAKCVVEGIKQNKLGIAKYLVDDVPPFDPGRPDPFADYKPNEVRSGKAADKGPEKAPAPFTSPAAVYLGISGPGKPVVGDGSGGWRSGADGVIYKGPNPKPGWNTNWGNRANGAAVKQGLIPPIKPIWDLHLRDTIICAGGDGNYYMTGSSGDNIWDRNDGVELWRSADLKTWDYLGLVWSIEKDGTWQKEWRSLHNKPARDVWAPEIHFIKGSYVLCLSMAPGGVSILKSRTGKPEGPYVSALAEDKPLAGGIDATLFEDDDGKVYFSNGGGGRIARMKDDLSGLAEQYRPVQIEWADGGTAGPPDDSGRRRSSVAMEGVSLFKANGRYYLGGAMFYHGRYSSVVVMADNVYGPYKGWHEAVPCGGGTNYFRDRQGNWFCCFFGNDDQAPWREKPGLIKIEFDKDGRIIVAKDQPSFVLREM